MCGIIGILGLTPVAPLLVDALKRLEYRGYDSAGIATLENGRLERAARRGQAAQPRGEARRPPPGRPLRHWPHPLGDAWRADRAQRPSARDRARRRRAQRHHREFPRAARWSSRPQAAASVRDRHRGRRASRHGQPRATASNRANAVQAALGTSDRRLRARLPVRGRGRPR